MKHGVQIIECIDKDDPGSEGRFLKHMFDLMRIDSTYTHVNSVDTFLKTIKNSKYDYIHITCHGLVSKDEKFKGWWTPNGVVTISNITKNIEKIAATAIISTACNSGEGEFGTRIVAKLGCKFYIAPQKGPYFHNSALFAHIFYHKLFYTKTKGDVLRALKAYDSGFKNPHKFTIQHLKDKQLKID